MTAARIDALPGGPGLAAGRGTAALMAAIRGLHLAGQEILVPVNLCPVAVAGLLWAGARPVLHDVDPHTGNARVEDIAATWRPSCRAVLAVHNLGMPVAIDAICDWAAARRMRVIEDCCNAVGATWQGRPVGSYGDAAVYSFGRGKIAATGGGGAIGARTTADLAAIGEALAAMPVLAEPARRADERLEARLRALRSDGISAAPSQRAAYEEYRPYAASHLPEGSTLIPAIADTLAGLTASLDRRRAMADHWRQRLAGSSATAVVVPEGTAPWRFNILVEPARRDGLIAALREAEIPCSRWYAPVAALFCGEAIGQPCYPGADAFAARIVNLWVDAATTAAAIETAAGLIARYLDSAK